MDGLKFELDAGEILVLTTQISKHIYDFLRVPCINSRINRWPQKTNRGILHKRTEADLDGEGVAEEVCEASNGSEHGALNELPCLVERLI